MQGQDRGLVPRVSSRRLGILGLAAFLLFAVLMIPASVVWRGIDGRGSGVRLAGVSGTLWTGTAGEVYYREIPLGTATWTWRPLALIVGEWRNRVRLQSGVTVLNGNVGRTLTGAWSGSDMVLDATMGELVRLYAGLSGALPVTIEGDLSMRLDYIKVRDGHVDAVDGRVDVDAVMLAGRKLGSLEGDLADEDGGIVVEFRSKGDEAAGLDGVLTLMPEGDYRLALAIGNPDLLGAEAAGFVRGLATQGGDGKWRLDWQGRL